MKKIQMYINGQWVDSQSNDTREIINPFDQSIIAIASEGDRSDSIEAIKAARDAFDSGPWSTSTGTGRKNLLLKMVDLIKKNHEELAELESLDTGKTVEESRWDMDDIAGIFLYYANLADKDLSQNINSPIKNSTSTVKYEAVGVCGQISPWNYPLLQASWKMAPALAAGCTIVMKPSEITPLTTAKIVELSHEAGFPPGVVNLVMGPGHTVGAELAENHNVDLISFTGGGITGRKIMQAATGNVKKIALELGGKNPHIIFEDAQIDVALDAVMNGVFFHAGQICSAGARVMVHEKIHDAFVDALKNKILAIKLGNGFDKDTKMGPLISKDHMEKVENFAKIGIDEGAHLLCGGKRSDDPQLSKGFFFEPTLFSGCTSQMNIVREETFGPIITVEKFSSEEEAINLANDTVYGLSAGFWTEDIDRQKRVSKALRFGTVWINDYNIYFVEAPWGGYKESGIGRELGHGGLEEYLETKHVFQNNKPTKLGWF